MTDLIQQAFRDWNEHRAYVDNGGNYRVRPEAATPTHRPSGKIAPWNKEVKRAFPSSAEFHAAAQEAKERDYAPAPQPPLDAGEEWHEWKHEEHDGKHGIFEGNLLIAVVGECVARPEYAPVYAAQIVRDHRSAAAVPKLVQALKQCDGLLVGYRASGVDVSTLARINEVLRVARKAIDEALTTVNQTGGG